MYRFALVIILCVTFLRGTEAKRGKKYSYPSSLVPLLQRKRSSCSSDSFDCGYKCIAQELVCDTERDCVDGTDELQNCPTDCSGKNQFKCGTGECVPGVYRCDSDKDCSDGSDEKNCGQSCINDLFLCANGHCLASAWVCDGTNDCGDSSDEKDCTCNSHQFSCNNGKCLWKNFVCDNYDDCGDGSDEQGCTCDSKSIQCKSGKCIPANYRCDGENDCGDMSDEEGCPEIHPGACADLMTFEDCLRMNGTTFPICATYADAHRFCRKFCNMCTSGK